MAAPKNVTNFLAALIAMSASLGPTLTLNYTKPCVSKVLAQRECFREVVQQRMPEVPNTGASATMDDLSLATYWWTREPNFGDCLTPALLAEFGIQAQLTGPRSAEFFGIGSILEHIPEMTRATIFGAGFMSAESRRNFASATILALRGRLSVQRIRRDVGQIALGDPGILFSKTTAARDCHPIGIVVHAADTANQAVMRLRQQHGSCVQIIDPRSADVQSVIDRIAACRYILSSSLHGLAVGWGLDIPCGWLVLGDKVWGRNFKFRDFYSAFDLEVAPQMLSGFETVSALQAMCLGSPKLLDERRMRLATTLHQFAAVRRERQLASVSELRSSLPPDWHNTLIAQAHHHTGHLLARVRRRLLRK